MPRQIVSPKLDQYLDDRNLAVRARFHQKYSHIAWLPWLADHLSLPEGASILDIGCGPGWLWKEIAGRIPGCLNLIMADLSQGMVEAARYRLANCSQFPNIAFLRADAEHLPFRQAQFDAVFAMHMLYHVPNPQAAISEFARVLRPTGVLFVTTNGENNLDAIHSLRATVLGGRPHDIVVERFDLKKADALIAKTFSSAKMSILTDVYEVTDSNDIFDYIVSLQGEQTLTLSQKDRLKRLIEEVLAIRGGIMKVRTETGLIAASKMSDHALKRTI